MTDDPAMSAMRAGLDSLGVRRTAGAVGRGPASRVPSLTEGAAGLPSYLGSKLSNSVLVSDVVGGSMMPPLPLAQVATANLEPPPFRSVWLPGESQMSRPG